MVQQSGMQPAGKKFSHLSVSLAVKSKGQQGKHPLTLFCQQMFCAVIWQLEMREFRNTPQGGTVSMSLSRYPVCFYIN